MDFVFFPNDSPILSLLPGGYTAAGVFQDFQEAMVHYSKYKSAETIASDSHQTILVVNGLNYYRNVSLLQREPEALLLQSLIKVRTAAGGIGIKLLMPEEKSTGQNLLIDLMSQGFYDFWFLTGLDNRLFQEVLTTTRSFRQLEAYLSTLPPPVIPEAEEGRQLWQIKLKEGSRILKAWMEKKMEIRKEDRLGLWGRRSGTIAKAMTGSDSSALNLAPVSVPASMPSLATLPEIEPVPVWVADAPPSLEEDHSPSGSPRSIVPLTVPSAASATVSVASRPFLKATSPKQWLSYNNFKLPGKSKKQQTPEVPRIGSTALFFSEEDCLLTYALAFLMAAHLAGSGSKTLLVELPGGGPRLEDALGLRRPEKNLKEALQDFAAGARGSWQNYCFRGDGSDYALLDILPQGQIEKKLYPFWDSFFASLVHWAIMEEQYTYVFYLGFGDRNSLCWKDSLICRRKIIAYSPWAPSFNEAPYLQGKWQSRCLPVFDGSWGEERIKKQMKNLALEQYVIIPSAIKKDFIQLTALNSKYEGASGESSQCLSDLWQNIQWQSIQ